MYVLKDILRIESECIFVQKFDFGKNKDNVTKFIRTFMEIKKTLVAG